MVFRMNRSMSFSKWISITAAAALCSACGASYVPISSGSTNVNNNASMGGNVSGLVGNSNGSSSSGTTGTTSSTGGSAPLITQQISGVGYTSVSISVSASSVLKMTFTSGVQKGVVSGTGYSPMYSHLGVYITANGSSQITGMLDNGLYSGAAHSSPVMDFPSTLTGALQAITVTVGQPNDAYFCLSFGEYCPWTQVYT